MKIIKTDNEEFRIEKINEDLQVENISNYLAGKSIALCVTGGIASIETPKLARHLRRYGADVTAYTTPTAKHFIGKAALEWATGKSVVDSLSGLAEHICLDDLVLVAPATLNTINKIFQGIADNSVTTLVGSALGKKVPIYLAPTMHESMYENPILKKNLSQASEYGISIISPRISEGKAKIPKLDSIVAQVCRELSADKLKGKKILVTGGSTPGKIDDVRMITNKFQGGLAVKIAKDAYHRGADVTLLINKFGASVPHYLNVLKHEDFDGYNNNVFSELAKGYEVGIFCAAVADYIPSNYQKGKIKSGGVLKEILLKPTSKVIKEVRKKHSELFMVTFKYEDGVTQNELIKIAENRINYGYDLVVANRAQEMGKSHCAYIIGKKGIIASPKSKSEISQNLLDLI